MVNESIGKIEEIKLIKPYKRIKDYYEIIIQLITGIMYSRGFKTLSNIGLIDYIKDFKELNTHEIGLIP